MRRLRAPGGPECNTVGGLRPPSGPEYTTVDASGPQVLKDSTDTGDAAALLQVMLVEYTRGSAAFPLTAQFGNVIAAAATTCEQSVTTINAAVASALDGTFAICEMTTPTTTTRSDTTPTPHY